jgi:TnpA family transposase
MALATPGISHSDISAMADWFFTHESLKAACIDIINYGFNLPITKHFGTGKDCSADGMRFYSPSNLLRTDFSPALKDRGITLVTHTADNLLMIHQQPIPCKMREAAYDLDGLLQHDTELEPTRCFTDTHGYTETVLASGSLLGYELAPRIKDIKDKTLYRFDGAPSYYHIDPIITGTIKPQLIHKNWDEIVRIMASIKTRRVSASLILTKLSSYARQNPVYQGLRELGRVDKTKLILKCLHDESFRRLQTKEINKGERSHGLDRFLFFAKQGVLRSREFADQTHSFSCLAILHNAIIAWNLTQLPAALERLRAKGHVITDEDLALVGPLLWKNVNQLGRYDINPNRLAHSW